MNAHSRFSAIRVARRCFWFVLVLAIGLEDFHRIERFRITHSHPYERGCMHVHPEFAAVADADLEDLPGPEDRDPNRHTHVIEVGSEVPSTAAETNDPFNLHAPGSLLAEVPDELTGPSRDGEGLRRPPRRA